MPAIVDSFERAGTLVSERLERRASAEHEPDSQARFSDDEFGSAVAARWEFSLRAVVERAAREVVHARESRLVTPPARVSNGAQ